MISNRSRQLLRSGHMLRILISPVVGHNLLLIRSHRVPMGHGRPALVVTSVTMLPPARTPRVTDLTQSGLRFSISRKQFPKRTDLDPSDVPVDIGEYDDTTLSSLVMA